MKYYAGIGSRETPRDIQSFMRKLASVLEEKGFVLRSGGAKGADSAFASGVKVPENKHIYLPWERFNNQAGIVVTGENRDKAREIAAKFHPAWNRLNDTARKFHTRNVYQVLGESVNIPSDFIVCWTSDGKASGGTGQALRIAKAYNIPIYNLHNKDVVKDFEREYF